MEVLREKGFGNVTVKTETSDAVAKGEVISQSPVGSNLTQYSTTVNIVLVVSSGSGSSAPETRPTEPTTEDESTTEAEDDETTTEADAD